MAAFFEATFRSWNNQNRSGSETAYVGYSPVIGFDGDKILSDFPQGHVIHVVRNPWSGFADTCKRPYPLSIERYSMTWAMMQHHALVFSGRFPDRFHIVRFEDLVASPRETLGKLCAKLGIAWNELAAAAVVEWEGDGKRLSLGHDLHANYRGEPRDDERTQFRAEGDHQGANFGDAAALQLRINGMKSGAIAQSKSLLSFRPADRRSMFHQKSDLPLSDRELGAICHWAPDIAGKRTAESPPRQRHTDFPAAPNCFRSALTTRFIG